MGPAVRKALVVYVLVWLLEVLWREVFWPWLRILAAKAVEQAEASEGSTTASGEAAQPQIPEEA